MPTPRTQFTFTFILSHRGRGYSGSVPRPRQSVALRRMDVDSRLRGNDRLGAAGCCRGFGGVLGSRAGLVSPVPPIGACRGAQPLCVSCDPPRVGARGLKGLRRTLRLPRLLLAWLGEWLAMTTIVAQAMALLIFLTARTTMATSTTSSPTRTNTLAAISDHPPPCWLIRTTGSTR